MASEKLNKSVRLARNVAEKQRRDKLNGYINELANTVPLVAEAAKRLDKTSILRLSAAYLRLHHSPLNAIKETKSEEELKPQVGSEWRPDNLSDSHMDSLMESMDGFVLITNTDYKIIYVSQSCEKYLGHQNIDMMGHCMASFIHPSDIDMMKAHMEKARKELILNGRLVSDRVSLRCRMRERTQPRTDVITYQVVQIIGKLNVWFEGTPAALTPNTVAKESQICTFSEAPRVSRKRNHAREMKYSNGYKTGAKDQRALEGGASSAGYAVLFKGFVKIIPTSPMAELSLVDSNQDEYVTRLTLDGTLLFADHRISLITGHMPQEVVGRSAYGFIITDDHTISLFAHKLMLSSSNGTGIIVHRLRTKCGTYVFLQSAGCLHYDRSTGQVDHFVCVSRLMMEDEGDKEREKFVRRFTPHISNSSPSALYESLQIVVGPRAAGHRSAAGTSVMSSCDDSFSDNSNPGSVRITEIYDSPSTESSAITAYCPDYYYPESVAFM